MRLQQAMQAAGNQRFEHKLMPGAEHSMFRATRGGEKETPFLKAYVAGYFHFMTDWATRQVVSSNRKPE
jgi:pyrroloquinoline quinone (PQQ) biosynthesis protein C